MKITLYKCSAENNRVSKSGYLTNAVNIDCNLIESCSLMNPMIRITDSAGTLNLTQYNYLYIPSWNRYYFIKEITSVRNGVYELNASIDVLNTYASGIKKLNGIIERQEYQYNSYYQDSLMTTKANPIVTTHAFPNSFSYNDYSIVLTVAGDNGGGS